MKTIFLNHQRKFYVDEKTVNFIVNVFVKYKIPQVLNNDNLELFVSFVSPFKIRKLKKELFDLDVVTDVISVGIETQLENINPDIPMIFGEIFICPEIAEKNSKKYGNSLGKELEILIIHGLLHLLGYKDYKDNEKLEMRKQENLILEKIEIEREF